MPSLSPAAARAAAHFPLRLAEVPALIYELTGETVNFKTCYRWTTVGRRGVCLETLPGIRKRTSRALVEKFLASLAAKGSQAPPPDVDRSLKREQKQKHRELAAAGR